MKGAQIGWGLPDVNQYNSVREVEGVVGSCMYIKREVIDKMGLLDELFAPCHYEQEDYCLRAKLSGFKIGMVTTAFFNHDIAGTTRENFPYYINVCALNRKKFLEKWKDLVNA